MYGAKADQIVGYTFQAEVYCPGCLEEMWFERPSEEALESRLDALATEQGIDRSDEWSFDSDDFPKVVFMSHGEDTFCGTCDVCLRCSEKRMVIDRFGNPRCPVCDGPDSHCEKGVAHIHHYLEARDCDGTIERSWIAVCPLSDDDDDEHARYRWWIEEQGWALPTTSDEPVTIEFIFMKSMTYTEPTEEGYRRVELRYCEDDCDLSEGSYRDRTAEAAGY